MYSCFSWEYGTWRRNQEEPPGPGYYIPVRAVSLSRWHWGKGGAGNDFILISAVVVWLIPGSGRVTFNNQRSYLKAVTAAFVEIKTTKFTKKVSGAGETAHGGVCVRGGTAGSTSVHGACPIFLLKLRKVGLLGMDLRYPGRGQSTWCSMPTASFSCRFRLTRTWRIPCAKCAMPSLAHSSAETR